jgi:hypothetical protein
MLAGFTCLTTTARAWEIFPVHMQKQMTWIKADDKGRVCVPGTKKGGRYLVRV